MHRLFLGCSNYKRTYRELQMLHFNAIEQKTLSLLNKLMQFEELKNFSLVGGTALALKYGHGISADLDLFSVEK